MKYSILLLVLICFIFSQDEEKITIYTTEGDTSQFHKFEIDFIKEIINLYNRNTSSKVSYTIMEVPFKMILQEKCLTWM